MLLVMLGVTGVLPGVVAGVASIAGNHRVEISWGKDQVVVVLAHDRGRAGVHHHNLGDRVAVFFASTSGPQANHIFASAMEEFQVSRDAAQLKTPQQPRAIEIVELRQMPADRDLHCRIESRPPLVLAGRNLHDRLAGVQMLL